jgi:chromosome segregation ATPase
LQKQLEEKSQECEAVRQELAAAKQKAAVPGIGNEQLRTRIEEIIRERERMQQQIAAYKAEIEQLREGAPSDSAELEAAKNQILDLQTKLAQAGQPLTEEETKARIAEAEERASSATMQLAQMQTQFESVRAQLLQTQSQAARQIDELTLQNRQLSARLNGTSYTAPVYSGELRLREAQDRVTMLEQELAAVRAENERLRSQSTMHPDELRSLYDKSRLYDDIKNNVGRIITEARKKASDMVAEAEASRNEILLQGMDGLTAMQSRIQTMKKEIDQAQKIYADTSISMSGMFNAINDAVNITDNQLISVLGPIPEVPQEEPKPEPKKNGNEDVWRTPIL